MLRQLDGEISLPSVLLCANDNIAMGVIRALNEKGYMVPEDISVVGFDDMTESHNIVPPLASLRNHHTVISRCAAQVLVDVLEKRRVGNVAHHIMVGCDFIYRESLKDITEK